MRAWIGALIFALSWLPSILSAEETPWARYKPVRGVEIALPPGWQRLDESSVVAEVNDALDATSATIPDSARANQVRIYTAPDDPRIRITIQVRSGPPGSFPTQEFIRTASPTTLERRNEGMKRFVTQMFENMNASLLDFSQTRTEHASGAAMFLGRVRVRDATGTISIVESLDFPFGIWQAGITASYPEDRAEELKATIDSALRSAIVTPPRTEPSDPVKEAPKPRGTTGEKPTPQSPR